MPRSYENKRLLSRPGRTFPAATLQSRFTTRPLLSTSLKDKLSVHSQNMLVYSFSCSCTEEYIGRTTRQLSTRAKEHTPNWLKTGDRKSIRSAVVAHLVDSGHLINPDTAFSVIYRAPRDLPRSIQARLISVAESIAIRIKNPVLCKQKTLIHPLLLPWPITSNSRTDFTANAVT